MNLRSGEKWSEEQRQNRKPRCKERIGEREVDSREGERGRESGQWDRKRQAETEQCRHQRRVAQEQWRQKQRQSQQEAEDRRAEKEGRDRLMGSGAGGLLSNTRDATQKGGNFVSGGGRWVHTDMAGAML